jgi:hypothetical protein
MNVRIFFDFMTLILKVPEFKILERKVYYIFLQNGFQIYEKLHFLIFELMKSI